MRKNIFLLVCLAVFGISCCDDKPFFESELKITTPDGIPNGILNPQTNYNFGINSSKYDSLVFSAYLYHKDGTRFTIALSRSNTLIVAYQPDTIPDAQWSRKEDNDAYVKGMVVCYRYVDNIVKDTAYYDFSALFKPDKPRISLLDNTKNGQDMTAVIEFDAAGAETYKVSCSAMGEVSGSLTDVPNKAMIHTLSGLSSAKRYAVYVEAVNGVGVARSEPLTIGSNYTTASCILTKTGTDIKYQVKVGETILEDLVILSAGIYDTDNTLKMELPKTQNQYFNITSLQPGVYVLRLEVKDYGSCGKSFFK